MKYENFEAANRLMKSIKADEKQLEQLTSTGVTIAIIDDKSNRIDYVKIGYQHSYSKVAEIFLSDCVQILRDKINQSKIELEKL